MPSDRDASRGSPAGSGPHRAAAPTPARRTGGEPQSHDPGECLSCAMLAPDFAVKVFASGQRRQLSRSKSSPHPASASLGHPLPGGERRIVTSRKTCLVDVEALRSTISSPQRGEGGRAKRRSGEGGSSNPTSSLWFNERPD